MKNLLQKNGFRAVLIAVFVVSALFVFTAVYAKAEIAEAKSECVVCHTDMKRLIRLSLEIKQARPKLDESAKTSGEG